MTLLKISLATLLFVSCARSNPRPLPSPPPIAEGVVESQRHLAKGKRFAIAAQGEQSAKAGDEIFAQGGNIIDAAVAVSFAISVERPQSTGIGGGGFLLFREGKTGKEYAIDFRERAPANASLNMFLDEKGNFISEKSLNGILSVATPGLVAGLIEIHGRWGKLPLRKVMAPAIVIAEKGLTVSPHLEFALKMRRDVIARDKAASKIFLHDDGSPFQAGEKIVQKDLSRTLRRIARLGRKGFYEGLVLKKILATSKKYNGILSKADFSNYQVKWRNPVKGTFRGLEIFSMPPPSSGGIHVLQILNQLENMPLEKYGPLSAQSIHLTASAMQIAYADRAVYPGDPDFVQVPTERLVSKAYAEDRGALISETRAKKSSEIKAGEPLRPESLETTHFSILDDEGNAVSSTQTINFAFGSGIVAEDTGILLNDEMDDFSAKPGTANAYGAIGGSANSIAPKKTPLSSMSPTIIMKNGKPVMAIGSPGGTRIINCVAQTILNYFVYQQSPWNSLALVRLHHQWMPDQLDMESPGPAEDVLKNLTDRGWNVAVKKGAVPCRVEMVIRDAEGTFTAVSDPRDAGMAVAHF